MSRVRMVMAASLRCVSGRSDTTGKNLQRVLRLHRIGLFLRALIIRIFLLYNDLYLDNQIGGSSLDTLDNT